MLCARVIAEDMSIETLISSSNEALASNEMKLKRRKVEEDAIKNVVLSADSINKKENPPPEGITSELASRIRIEGGASPSQPVQGDDGIGVSSSFSGEDFSHSPLTPSSPSTAQPISEATMQILASIPPPPMRSETTSASNNQLDSPPASPLLYSYNNEARHAARLPRSQHIMS